MTAGGGVAEQNPEDWWHAMQMCVQELLLSPAVDVADLSAVFAANAEETRAEAADLLHPAAGLVTCLAALCDNRLPQQALLRLPQVRAHLLCVFSQKYVYVCTNILCFFF